MKRMIVALLMAAGLLVAIPSPPAAAVAGCWTSPVRLMSSTWTRTAFGPGDTYWEITAHERYLDCPDNPNDPSQSHSIQAKSTRYCVKKLNQASWLYIRGFRFNVYIANEKGVTTNPASFDIDWYQGFGKTGDVKCATHDHGDSPWMWLSSHPFWTLTAWQRCKVFNDPEYLCEEWVFWNASSNSTKRYFTPGSDDFTGTWVS